MAYDEGTAERLRDVFADFEQVAEKKMFGGIAFMCRGNMVCGIVGDTLMARVGPDAYDDALQRPSARKMDFTGRPMKGFVYVDPPGFSEESQLQEWVALCKAFADTLPPK